MRTFTAIVEKDPETGLYVGYIPGVTGAHTQGTTLDELRNNLHEVVELLSESGKLVPDSQFIGTQHIVVP